MPMVNKTILIISPEPWDHIFVSKHHYAFHLAELGNKVFFLNPPHSKWGKHSTSHQNLTILNYTRFIKGLRYLPKLLRSLITKRKFQQLEKLAETTFDIFWSFDNSVFYQMDSLPKRVIKISHIVDFNQISNGKIAGINADIVFSNSSPINQRFKSLGIKSHFVNHGFHLPTKPVHVEIPTSQRIKVGYAGNLDIMYLDWDLIIQVISSHPTLDFFFAGSKTNKKITRLFESKDNIHWIGKLLPSQLQSFYSQMDMLILTYNADKHCNQLANPHKMLEYLYSGKPVVATYTAEYANTELLYMSDGNEEWPSLFGNVANDLSTHSTPTFMKQRREFALNNTYEKQILHIESLIEEHVNTP